MTHPATTATIIAAFLSLAGASSAANAAETWKDQTGIASTYSGKSGKTTSGEKTDVEGMTAAHRSLPFGTIVRVVNSQNDRFVMVRINDRGPFTRGRVIDLTPAAARVLGFSGLARVRLSVVTAVP
jgi:rare lipoprotein A